MRRPTPCRLDVDARRAGLPELQHAGAQVPRFPLSGIAELADDDERAEGRARPVGAARDVQRPRTTRCTVTDRRRCSRPARPIRGPSLVDYQHPHDVVMAANARFEWPIGSRWRLSIEGGPVGAPAIGPDAVHASCVGRGQSHGAARASSPRLDARHARRGDGRRDARRVHRGGLGVSRPRGGRGSAARGVRARSTATRAACRGAAGAGRRRSRARI